MQRIFLGFLILSFSMGISSAQEIDTLALKAEVENLKTGKSKKAFLRKILDEDQKYRGNSTNDTLDFLHLISVSYYFNEYGFPKKKDFGDAADAMWLVYAHSKWKETSRISFPLILKGFLIGEIKQSDIRNYFSSRFHKFDDYRFKTMSIKALLESCEVELGDKISIKNLIKAKTQIDSLESIKIVNRSNWKTDPISNTYEVNGEQLVQNFDPQLITIIERVDGRLFLIENIYKDYLPAPTELINISGNRYRYKHKTASDHYFEFLEGKILYKNKTETLQVYSKTAVSKGYNSKYR